MLASLDTRANPQARRTVYRDGSRTAAIRFGDTLRSTRSASGIHYATRSILWSEAVLQEADAAGIQTLEVIVTDRHGKPHTYRAPLAVMLERGEVRQTPAGRQRGLTLGAWTVDGAESAAQEPTPAPQLGLFAEV